MTIRLSALVVAAVAAAACSSNGSQSSGTGQAAQAAAPAATAPGDATGCGSSAARGAPPAGATGRRTHRRRPTLGSNSGFRRVAQGGFASHDSRGNRAQPQVPRLLPPTPARRGQFEPRFPSRRDGGAVGRAPKWRDVLEANRSRASRRRSRSVQPSERTVRRDIQTADRPPGRRPRRRTRRRLASVPAPARSSAACRWGKGPPSGGGRRRGWRGDRVNHRREVAVGAPITLRFKPQ